MSLQGFKRLPITFKTRTPWPKPKFMPGSLGERLHAVRGRLQDTNWRKPGEVRYQLEVSLHILRGHEVFEVVNAFCYKCKKEIEASKQDQDWARLESGDSTSSFYHEAWRSMRRMMRGGW